MTEELSVRCCPACNFATASNGGQKNGFPLLSCDGCGTLFTAHLPNKSSEQDYNDYYSPASLMSPDFVNRRLDEIVSAFSHYRQSNRLLDIGCGGGALLQAAGRAGWQAEGMEVSLPSVEHVRQLGFEIFYGYLEAAEYPMHNFDVVTAVEVLEHVPYPQELMKEVARILRPGGLFWATTPHGCGLSARLLGREWSVVSPPEHLQLFSTHGMKALLKNAGFRRTEIVTSGLNPYEILHVLQSRRRPSISRSTSEVFNRVQSSHHLNEELVKSPGRRLVKNSLNQALNVMRLGDSLKVRSLR